MQCIQDKLKMFQYNKCSVCKSVNNISKAREHSLLADDKKHVESIISAKDGLTYWQ